jgi:biopolymer transport protein ExbD
MAEVSIRRRSAVGKGRPVRRRRVGIRLDMTPMVDVAFLLLTFFMLTTAFRQPQTLEITLPTEAREREPARILERNILVIRVDEQNRLFWSVGREKSGALAKDRLRGLIYDRSRDNIETTPGSKIRDRYKLVVLIKIHPRSKYENMIEVVDELDLAVEDLNRAYDLSGADVLSPRFVLTEWSDKDTDEVRAATSP